MKNTNEIDGWFGYERTYDLLLDTIPDGGTFVECGAWLGKSSSYLCDKASMLNKQVNIFIVDSWQGSKNEEDYTHRLAKTADIYQIFLNNMGSRKFTNIKQLSIDAAKNFKDHSLDVIFIDMCHIYECVKEDIEIWYPKLKINGYIAGHDYTSWLGVNKAVTEKFKKVEHGDGDCWIVHNTLGVYND
jgi:hypothetical protein